MTVEDPSPERVREALRGVIDPEFPVSVVDLGLVRSVDVQGGVVRVGLTFTSLGCPCTELIKEDVRGRVASVEGVTAVEVEEVFQRWSRADVSDRGLRTLRVHGVV
ncbi:MAG: metal-sulfur cluster assembly factor [Candidatus Dormibacteraeota bacterium]|nr:metal-sulfur cluster assembly factor [Candidatus Dormibacteraeota bacterium]